MKMVFSRAIALALFFAVYAIAGTFYFLPPNDPDWIKKTPYIYFIGGDFNKMNLVPDACGLYKATISNSEKRPAVIWQGSKYPEDDDVTTDRIGVYGLDEGPESWDEHNMPTPIIFETKFDDFGDPLYFDAKNGWSSTEPAYDPDKDYIRCRYTMAGLIYDTDESKMNGSFTRYTGSNPDWIGIRREIVKPTLAKNSKNISKMQWNNKTGRNAAQWNEDDFKKAFECTPGTNALVCYDMPFYRDSKELWTFDSDFLCSDGTLDLKPNRFTSTNANTLINSLCSGRRPMLSFAPNILNTERSSANHLGQQCTYDACSSCYNTYEAEPLTPFSDKVNPACYEKALTSTSTTGSCGGIFNDGQLGDGGDPDIWDWGARDNLRSKMSSRNLNSFFCFETHAEFTYEEGQEFYFSGDDDIWVFINNNLVIDLGGSHLASPGYVNLDSIGRGGRWRNMGQPLEEGKEYDIDIFFCDRRTNASNIRITTNMYISQKNGLFKKEGNGTTSFAEVCMTRDGGGTCDALLDNGGAGTQELCGNKVAEYIEFYIISRNGEEKYILNSANPNCKPTATPDEILCYNGITVNLKNGKAKADKDKVDLSGTWYLYARITEDKAAEMKPPPEDVKLATFTPQANIKMVYGNIRGEKGSKITDVACQGPDVKAVTSQLKPVCFSDGTRDASGFIIDPDAVGGSVFRLKPEGLENHLKNKLKVYWDSTGKTPVTDLGASFTIPGGPNKIPTKSNSGSAPGLLVLWVTGDYKQDIQNDTYEINVKGRPASEAVTLTSIVPIFQWIKKPGDQAANPENVGSIFDADGKAERTSSGKPVPAWIRQPIKLNLRAYDSTTGATCKTCNFSFALPPGGYTAKATKTGAPELEKKNKNLIDIAGLEIINGEAVIEVIGKVDLVNDFPDYYATVTVNGLSKLQDATWDSLQFEKPPVPIPDSTKLFDVNGDGIGDRLVIYYNRGFKPDSLPNMIEVFWDKDSTIRYGISKPKVEGKDTVYSPVTDTSANRKYWEKYLKVDLNARVGLSEAELEKLKDSIVLNLDSAGLSPAVFSKKVLTQGEGKVRSWASFIARKGGGSELQYNLGFTSSIDEKMPAIVISAKYVADSEAGCGKSKNTPCTDRLTIEFSEPVFKDAIDNASVEEAKNPFAYMLRNLQYATDFNILKSGSQQMKFKDKDVYPSESGDSVVILTYWRWRDANDNSGTPMPGDSVKFAAVGVHSGFSKNVFRDVKDNAPNPNEIGKQIEGRNPFEVDKIAIGEIDPNSDRIREDIGYVLANIIHSKDPSVINKMYTKDRPVEILPVPRNWTLKDVESNYKGTIGLLLNPDVFNTLAEIDSLGEIPDNAITFYAKVFYHTNLGSYVADRSFSVSCADDIFPEGSCRKSMSKIYIAWDMKDFKGRFVGTGAYVGLYDFRWEIDYPPKGVKTKYNSMERKVEMHGVKRVVRKQ